MKWLILMVLSINFAYGETPEDVEQRVATAKTKDLVSVYEQALADIDAEVIEGNPQRQYMLRRSQAERKMRLQLVFEKRQRSK